MVNDKDGDVFEGSGVDDGGIVELVQDMGLVIFTKRPCDDLGLSAFELYHVGIVEESLSEGDVREDSGRLGEVSGNDVVRKDLSEKGLVAGDITGDE